MFTCVGNGGASCKPRAFRLTLSCSCASAVLLCFSLAALAHASDESDCSLSSVEEGIQKGIIIKKSDDQVANHAMYLERKTLLHIFHLFPAFYFMTGKGSRSACAFPESDPDRGIVTFGEELLRREVSDAGGPQYASSVPAIMAHEFAHLLQIKNGSTSTGPKYELQADYIAGWYMGRRAKLVPTTVSPQQSLQTIMRSFYAKGDYQLNDASHHGTPEERVGAISAGYRNSELQIPDMYRESLKFVAEMHENMQPVDSDTGYDPLELSRALTEVMKHQPNRFADLRGKLDEDSKATWIATLKLPGAVRCVIEWRNEYQGNYDCDMTVSLDQGMAENSWKTLVDEVQKRYAKGWKRTDSTSSQSTVKEVVFTNPSSDDISLKVAIAKSTLHRGYNVEIEIPFDNY
jgi:hypothetical protein